MWASPAKGLTVMVDSFRTTWLTEKPPSMTGTPRMRQGKIPENTGMKVDAITDCREKGIIPIRNCKNQKIFSLSMANIGKISMIRCSIILENISP